MLKQTLATHFLFIFLGLLSSVTSEAFLANTFNYDSLPILISTYKEKCSERPDSFSCRNRDTVRYKISDSELTNAFKQTKELAPENGILGKEIPEDNSADEISIEIPIVDPENPLQKRFSVFRRKSPAARGYKRGPGFRSWGGKRDSMLSEQNLDKKSKFVSWGGKRDLEFFSDDSTPPFEYGKNDAPDKRPKFQNWGGKKSSNNFLEELDKRESPISDDLMEKKGLIWKNRRFYFSEPFKQHVPKRPQFQSWGGKRAQNHWREFVEFLQQKPRLLLSGGEKRKFSSWGGKRSNENLNQYGESHSEENSKRNAFQNWGGKRGTSDVSSHQDNEDVFGLKEPESGGKTKVKDEQTKTNWENDELRSEFNSWGEELTGGKDGR